MVLVKRRHGYPLYRWGSFPRTVQRLWNERPDRPVEQRADCGYLPVDAYTTPESFVIQANLPGVKLEAVSITIEDDKLTLKAELPEPADDVEYAIQERAWGEYERILRFNVPIDAEAAEATFENGVLTLTVPKAENAKPRTIKVKTG
jgi:HSP20 family protein